MGFKKNLKKVLTNILFFKKQFLKRELRVFRTKSFSESEIIFLFLKYFSKYKLMIDVGAHFGESFIPYEKEGWLIFAFEPDPDNRKLITTYSATTKIFSEAITDKDNQEMIFYTSNESTGISGLSAFHHSHLPVMKVKTKTLRTFIHEYNIKNVDFLKIDTEGFDLFVLKGFPFEKIKPIIILCEFENKKTLPLGYTYTDLGTYLKSKGYDIYLSEWYPIIKYGGNHTWSTLENFPQNKLKENDAWGNFIAIRSDYTRSFEIIKDGYLDALGKKR